MNTATTRVAILCRCQGAALFRSDLAAPAALAAQKPEARAVHGICDRRVSARRLRQDAADEREGPVAPEDLPMAFNAKPLRYRSAVVAAGPLANLLLAVLLYAIVNWIGVQQPKAVLASPVPGSLAERADIRGGEWVQRAGFADETRRGRIV